MGNVVNKDTQNAELIYGFATFALCLVSHF